MDKILQKIDDGRSYRNMKVMEVRVAQSDDDTEEYRVEGYATTFNQPYELYRWGDDYIVNEQVDAHAFDSCDMEDVILQYDHQGRVYARTSNNTLKLEVDSKGLKVTADLSGTEEGRKLYEEIKGGYTTKMSFGFVIEADERKVENDCAADVTTVLRTITKIRKLYDVSAVSLPANDATEISARNFGEGVIKEIEAERLERAKAKKLEMECLALLSL